MTDEIVFYAVAGSFLGTSFALFLDSLLDVLFAAFLRLRGRRNG